MTIKSAARSIIACFALTAASLASTPAAHSEPGIPGTDDAHCAGYGLGNTAMACDGPIQPDGTWRRCMQWQAQPFFNGQGGMGGFIPGGSDCRTLDAGNIPFGQPGHIDG